MFSDSVQKNVNLYFLSFLLYADEHTYLCGQWGVLWTHEKVLTTSNMTSILVHFCVCAVN